MTKEEILARVDEEELFRRYCPVEFTINRRFKSPLPGRDEATGSFFIFSKSGKLFFKDQGEGLGGDVWDYIGAQLEIGSFREIISRVATDLGTDTRKVEQVKGPVSVRRPPGRSKTIQKYTPAEWDGIYKWYWLSYGVGLTGLKRLRVEPIDDVTFMTNKGETMDLCSYENAPLFLFRHSNSGLKFYNPIRESKQEIKFVSNTNETDVYGLDLVPEGADCVLTGGNKDVVTLCDHGVHAICLNSENAKLSPLLYVHIRRQVGNLTVLYDTDSTGVKQAEGLAKQFNLPTIDLRDIEFEGKDVSDLIKGLKKQGMKKPERKQQIQEICK